MASNEQAPSGEPIRLRKTAIIVGELPTEEQVRRKTHPVKKMLAKAGLVVASGVILVGASRLANQNSDQSENNNNLSTTSQLDLTRAQSANQKPLESQPKKAELSPEQQDILPNSKLTARDISSYPGRENPTFWRPFPSPDKAQFLKDEEALQVQTSKDGVSSWKMEKPISVQSRAQYFLKFTPESSSSSIKPQISFIGVDKHGNETDFSLSEHNFDLYSGESKEKVFPVIFPEGVERVILVLSATGTYKEGQENQTVNFTNMSFKKANPLNFQEQPEEIKKT